ncbi:MAG: Trm112 family protein [Pseudomonadota bacterium]
MTDTNTDTSNSPCGVSPRLLEVLICPVTGGPLVFDKEACELISNKAKLAFPIRDGLPILLESEARDLEASSS